MSQDRHDVRVKRRSVLKAIGASALASGTFVGSSAARRQAKPAELGRVKARYENPVVARAAVVERAGPLLEDLQERGVLASGSVSEFGLNELVSPNEYSDSTERATVRSVLIDGEWDAEIATSTETDAHTVELVVRPRRELSYALVDPKDGGDIYRLTLVGNDDVSVSTHCHYESKCLSWLACESGSNCQRQERHCCDDNGDGVEDDCTSWYNDGCCTLSSC
jgi:hypothetical protein